MTSQTNESEDVSEEQVNFRNNDIWNLYGLIDPNPLSSTENDDINYVSMVAIGAATSAALWKAHFYRPEEMDEFTTYSMYIVTFLTIVGGVYVIYSIRKREKQAKNQVENNKDSVESENQGSSETNTSVINDNSRKSNVRRRKNRVE